MPEMRSVFSSNVETIGHDPQTKELHVRWQGGKTSIYAGVPADTARQVMNAHSVGKAVNEFIKPYFDHKYAS